MSQENSRRASGPPPPHMQSMLAEGRGSRPSEPSPPAGSRDGEGRKGPGYHAALAAVIILGVLLVAGVVALIFGFMRQYQIYRTGHVSASLGAPAVIELEAGAHIVSVRTEPDRLILQLATPKGGEVEVLDLSTGKLLYRVAAPHS